LCCLRAANKAFLISEHQNLLAGLMRTGAAGKFETGATCGISIWVVFGAGAVFGSGAGFGSGAVFGAGGVIGMGWIGAG
jgi:hypothetical protein